MARNFIPGEDLVEVQPWVPQDIEVTPPDKIRPPTAEELEQLRRDAQLEGYEAGRAEGWAVGYQEGLAQARDEAEHLRQLADALAEASQRFEQELAQDLLALALDIAKQMLRQALKVKPELLLPVVRSAMESLPQHAQHPHLHLHPEDVELVRRMLESELPHAGWKLIEDGRVARGGCRIETATSELDATLPSRWQRIASALGQDNAWLEDEISTPS
ncbi:MAG: flagellar assembly protein FliH [Methylophilaceae bacterium]|nr:flagellar assembly protein FliH [Methylophilaceae bacterium]